MGATTAKAARPGLALPISASLSSSLSLALTALRDDAHHRIRRQRPLHAHGGRVEDQQGADIGFGHLYEWEGEGEGGFEALSRSAFPCALARGVLAPPPPALPRQPAPNLVPACISD